MERQQNSGTTDIFFLRRGMAFLKQQRFIILSCVFVISAVAAIE